MNHWVFQATRGRGKGWRPEPLRSPGSAGKVPICSSASEVMGVWRSASWVTLRDPRHLRATPLCCPLPSWIGLAWVTKKRLRKRQCVTHGFSQRRHCGGICLFLSLITHSEEAQPPCWKDTQGATERTVQGRTEATCQQPAPCECAILGASPPAPGKPPLAGAAPADTWAAASWELPLKPAQLLPNSWPTQTIWDNQCLLLVWKRYILEWLVSQWEVSITKQMTWGHISQFESPGGGLGPCPHWLTVRPIPLPEPSGPGLILSSS